MRPAFTAIIEARLSPEYAGAVAKNVLRKTARGAPVSDPRVLKKMAQSRRVAQGFHLRGLKNRYYSAAT